MDIQRIDGCEDARFSRTVLCQHGAYLVSGQPCSVEIIGPETAVVRGEDAAFFPALIEVFRFHAPHICRFLDADGRLLAEYPRSELLTVPLEALQPSQFYVDADKLAAVRTFIHAPEDVIVQVLPWGERFIVLDGHTRLYLAAQRGYAKVLAVLSETDEWIWTFVREARRRGVLRPGNMELLTHAEYVRLWDGFCDAVFAGDAGPAAPLENDSSIRRS